MIPLVWMTSSHTTGECKQNEKLKMLLAEKEFENALLRDALKKDGEGTMNMANEYIDRGLRVSDVANVLHIQRCSFYRNDSSEAPLTRRGRKNSSFTLRNYGDTTVVVDNRIIVNEMETLLSRY